MITNKFPIQKILEIATHYTQPTQITEPLLQYQNNTLIPINETYTTTNYSFITEELIAFTQEIIEEYIKYNELHNLTNE